MQASTPVAGNADRYADIVAKHAKLRRLIGAAGEVAEIGYSGRGDVDEALSRAEALICEVTRGAGFRVSARPAAEAAVAPRPGLVLS